jgi:hypothetical protein
LVRRLVSRRVLTQGADYRQRPARDSENRLLCLRPVGWAALIVTLDPPRPGAWLSLADIRNGSRRPWTKANLNGPWRTTANCFEDRGAAVHDRLPTGALVHRRPPAWLSFGRGKLRHRWRWQITASGTPRTVSSVTPQSLAGPGCHRAALRNGPFPMVDDWVKCHAWDKAFAARP